MEPMQDDERQQAEESEAEEETRSPRSVVQLISHEAHSELMKH